MTKKMSKPKKTFRLGCAVAAVWENERGVGDETYPFQSVTLSRRYKDNHGQWASSNSFNKNDLPKLKIVVQRAYEYMNSSESEEESETQ